MDNSTENPKGKKREDPTVDLTKFELSKTVGMGSFGRVRLCRHKRTGKVYVMKILKKCDIIKHVTERKNKFLHRRTLKI